MSEWMRTYREIWWTKNIQPSKWDSEGVFTVKYQEAIFYAQLPSLCFHREASLAEPGDPVVSRALSWEEELEA